MRAQERILVIDDEPSVADALKVILEDCGFGVTVAATGREGIEQARRERFGVLITDLRLPDVDGLEVLRAAREADAGAAVILITSQHTPELGELARARGAACVIAKPFLPAEIIRAVAAALARPGAGDSSE